MNLADYKVVVISLRNSKRRDSLKERLAEGGITDYEVIDAREVLDINQSTIEALTQSEWKTDPRLKNETKNSARMACYLSHVSLVLAKYDQPIIVLEDDIVFKKPIQSIGVIPEDCAIGFLDGTKIEKFNGYDFCQDWSCGWLPIDTEKFRVWCLGCYICPDPQKVYNTLISCEPRVVDKLFIDCFQRDRKSYVYLPIICKQNRRDFKSTIA